MAVKHIAFTMYSVRDMAKAREFYEKHLGLTLGHDYEGKWVEYYPGGNGCFAITSMVPQVKPSARHGGSISFEVDDIEATVKELEAKGVKVAAKTFSTPVCKMAYLLDPDGNSVGLHQKHPGRE
jgi:predicted enzyme related to lactoylglutathione lyase